MRSVIRLGAVPARTAASCPAAATARDRCVATAGPGPAAGPLRGNRNGVTSAFRTPAPASRPGRDTARELTSRAAVHPHRDGMDAGAVITSSNRRSA